MAMRWGTSAHSSASSPAASSSPDSSTTFAPQSWMMYDDSSAVRWRLTAVM